MKKKLMAYILTGALLLSGAVATGSDTADAASGTWKKNAKGWWYSCSDGTYAKEEWLQYGGKWYYFNSAGYMQTGWK